MRRLLFVASAAWWVGFVGPLTSQEVESAEAFGAAYVAAMQSSDWPLVASYMHPDALSDFKSAFRELSEMDPSGDALEGLFGVGDPEAFEATAPADIFSAFMGNIMGAMTGLDALLSGTRTEFIGTVDEGGLDVTHLVYRLHMDLDGVVMSEVEVMPLRRHEGQWRALLTGEIEGMVALMRARFENGL